MVFHFITFAKTEYKCLSQDLSTLYLLPTSQKDINVLFQGPYVRIIASLMGTHTLTMLQVRDLVVLTMNILINLQLEMTNKYSAYLCFSCLSGWSTYSTTCDSLVCIHLTHTLRIRWISLQYQTQLFRKQELKWSGWNWIDKRTSLYLAVYLAVHDKERQ